MPPEMSSISPPINKILKGFKEDIETTVNGENDKAIENPSRKREAIGIRSKRKWEYFKTAQPKSRKARFTKYVILVRTVWSAKGVPARVEIDVKGELLQQVLIEINKDTKSFVLDKSNEIVGALFMTMMLNHTDLIRSIGGYFSTPREVLKVG
ncbi:uncharacterized protein A1O9_06823 [Exophiala aquamarina CBS 119918]|uniref:Uncharacterized protein n=1 Tax=Exophiala aquamarina CBS 119918 TaxID=1182545 RepID=A0A072P930_9EURO|nr:uncharacterized protein A1O9_06823 [Exophiala aquamarina CBS 119918]KEF56634.1 hypothetical protein A1O9_06823 [Exophiala aquamarina CBS 119918]